jgi:hypothetical protein
MSMSEAKVFPYWYEGIETLLPSYARVARVRVPHTGTKGIEAPVPSTARMANGDV